jgi:hypothetical protein
MQRGVATSFQGKSGCDKGTPKGAYVRISVMMFLRLVAAQPVV